MESRPAPTAELQLQLQQMAPKAPPKAVAPAAATSPAAAPVATARQIQHKFDSSTEECVVDVRSLARLPANADEDGVHTLRAIFLQKGHTVHVPDEPGCYATTGAWRTQTALCLVHFIDKTQRQDELLLSFCDYGMVSNTMTGVYISSLQLPLQKQRNVYEETARYTPITDVAGFTNINANNQPWCAMLKPAIERQQMLAQLQVFKALDIVTHMKTSLETRLETLRAYAEEDVAKIVEDLARQDKKAAEKSKARYLSRLAATVQFFQDRQLSKYERPMKERVIVLSADTDMAGVHWLKTPTREDITKGTARLTSTAMCRRVISLDDHRTSTGACTGTSTVTSPGTSAVVCRGQRRVQRTR